MGALTVGGLTVGGFTLGSFTVGGFTVAVLIVGALLVGALDVGGLVVGASSMGGLLRTTACTYRNPMVVRVSRAECEVWIVDVITSRGRGTWLFECEVCPFARLR